MTEEIKKRINTIKAGKVPDGYKKTKFGIFPTEWVTNKVLGEIGTFGKGRGIPGTMLGTGNVPCVGYGDIYMKYDHFHFEKARSFVDEQTAQESFPISKGTLLFTGTGETAEEIGKCVCYNGDETIYAGGDIITFNSQTVDPLFLAYQQYQGFSLKRKARLGQGHSVVHIHKENLDNLPVAFPVSGSEQKKITEILLKWDKAIELQEELIEKLERQKKALMQKLLKPQKGWKKARLGELAFMQSGGTPKSTVEEYYNGDIIWVSINDMSTCGKYLSNSERKLTLKGLENSSARLFPKGTVLYAMYASIGKCCIATSECSTSQAILGITTGKSLASEYLYYFLLHNQEKIIAQGQKGTQSNLNKEMVQSIKVDLPRTIEEQQAIVKALHTADSYIDTQTEKYNALKQQQQAMQQLLLTGIVRV